MNRHSWEEVWATPQRFTILVVDDEVINIQLAFTVLKEQFRVVMATSGTQALEVCRKIRPDLVLMDVMMAGLSGLEVCKAMAADTELEDIPVIFLTGLNDAADEARCWEAGCVDFIAKPFHFNTLKNRVKVHLMLKYQKELLKLSSYTDGLTGIKNRMYFAEALSRQLLQAARDKHAISLIMLDVDFFKTFNDRYGHVAGDDALRKVASALLRCCVRPLDIVARYGGEEFALILPATERSGVEAIAERIHQEIASLHIAHAHSATGQLTVSVGCHVLDDGSTNADAFIRAADQQLYLAKGNGRNCTSISSGPAT